MVKICSLFILSQPRGSKTGMTERIETVKVFTGCREEIKGHGAVGDQVLNPRQMLFGMKIMTDSFCHPHC